MAEETKGSEGVELQASPDPTKEVSKDFVVLLESSSADARAKASAGDLTGALELLLAVEKKTRVGGDSVATARVVKLMIDLCWEARNLEQLIAQTLLLCKRRAQSSRAIKAVVQRGVEVLEDVTDKEERVKLITTLRTVSAGRIFVELERARMTRTLSAIYEADGKINEASEMLQEVAVETCGAMEKKEKADFLLEQLRLCLAQKDFIRTEIVSRKVNAKTLALEGFESLRIKFYNLMIELHTHQAKALDLFRDWEAVYTTRGVADDDEKAATALKHACLFLCLSAYDNEQIDNLHKLSQDKRLNSMPTFQALLKHFTTDEIASWPLPEQSELDVFVESVPGDWATLLHKRVVQHNIRIIAKYYQRIRFARFASLISQSLEHAETFLSEMVTTKMVYARIDRPNGIVSFQRPLDANATLTEWSSDIGELLKLVETSCHLINKERMVHMAAKKK